MRCACLQSSAQPCKKGRKPVVYGGKRRHLPQMLFRQDIICIDVAHIQSLLLADPIQNAQQVGKKHLSHRQWRTRIADISEQVVNLLLYTGGVTSQDQKCERVFLFLIEVIENIGLSVWSK